MSSRTLLLTSWMSPLKVISWQAAVTLLYLGKVDVVEEYEGEDLSSPSMTLRMPAVIRLKRPVGHMKRSVKFSRDNVLLRDRFQCQYCGERKEQKDLNYDHIVPRCQGGKTNWLNGVAACLQCNGKKGGRTPAQAKMTLLRKPFEPASLPVQSPLSKLRTFPKVWERYAQIVKVSATG